MKPHGHPTAAKGAITLLTAIALVALAALASLYSHRSVLMDLLAGQNHDRAEHARLAAEAALAWAQADLVTGSDAWDRMMALAVPCPTPQGRQWACTRVDAPPWPAQAEASAQVTAQRDLIKAPHVWVLQAQAQRPGQSSRGQVQESVFVPVLAPAPGDAPTAALVLNGCLSEAAPVSLQICPLTRTGPACAGPPVPQPCTRISRSTPRAMAAFRTLKRTPAWPCLPPACQGAAHAPAPTRRLHANPATGPPGAACWATSPTNS